MLSTLQAHDEYEMESRWYTVWCWRHIRPLIKIITSFSVCFSSLPPLSLARVLHWIGRESYPVFSTSSWRPPVRTFINIFSLCLTIYVLNLSILNTFLQNKTHWNKKLFYSRITLPSRTFYNDEMFLAILILLLFNLDLRWVCEDPWKPWEIWIGVILSL